MNQIKEKVTHKREVSKSNSIADLLAAQQSNHPVALLPVLQSTGIKISEAQEALWREAYLLPTVFHCITEGYPTENSKQAAGPDNYRAASASALLKDAHL